MKKSVIHIITGLGSGGAERSLFSLLSGPCGTAFRHTVVSLTSDGTYGAKLRDFGIPVTSLDLKRMPWKLLSLPSFIRLQNADIVQGWMYHGNLAAFFSSSRDVRLLWNVRHGLEDIYREKQTSKWVIQANAMISARADKVIFNAEVSRKQHIAIGFSQANTQVIANGFDTNLFRFRASGRARIRKECNINDDALVVGHLGRFHPIKDHDTFLTAGRELLTSIPQTHLLLAGSGVEISSPFFRDNIPESLRTRVHLLGDRGDIPDILSAMDVFVQSSKAEGFPNVLGEAMSAGRACVATDVGDSALVLGDAGRIVASRNPSMLERSIRDILTDPDYRAALGELARAKVLREFPIERTTDTYIELYRSLS